MTKKQKLIEITKCLLIYCIIYCHRSSLTRAIEMFHASCIQIPLLWIKKFLVFFFFVVELNKRMIAITLDTEDIILQFIILLLFSFLAIYSIPFAVDDGATIDDIIFNNLENNGNCCFWTYSLDLTFWSLFYLEVSFSFTRFLLM